MLSGNGTIDYDVEAHTLDAHKTSAARQESTTRNLQASRLTSSMLTRLPLRVKGPPRETYMVASPKTFTHDSSRGRVYTFTRMDDARQHR